MQRPNRPPALVPAAARLLYICLTLNCLYLLGVALVLDLDLRRGRER